MSLPLPYLSAGTNCSWGRAINVAERYIYVTQPRLDRVLVVSVSQMVVVDVSNVWSCALIQVVLDSHKFFLCEFGFKQIIN